VTEEAEIDDRREEMPCTNEGAKKGTKRGINVSPVNLCSQKKRKEEDDLLIKALEFLFCGWGRKSYIHKREGIGWIKKCRLKDMHPNNGKRENNAAMTDEATKTDKQLQIRG